MINKNGTDRKWNGLTDNWQYLLQMTKDFLIKCNDINSKYQSEKLYLIYTQVVCNFKNAKKTFDASWCCYMLSSSSHLSLGWILLGRCYFIDYPSNLLFTLSVLLIPNVASKQNSDGKTCNIFNILLMILTGQSGIKPSF